MGSGLTDKPLSPLVGRCVTPRPISFMMRIGVEPKISGGSLYKGICRDG